MKKNSDHLVVLPTLQTTGWYVYLGRIWKNSRHQLSLQHHGTKTTFAERKLQTLPSELNFQCTFPTPVLNLHLPLWLHNHTHFHQTPTQEWADILALGINANWTVWSSLLHFRCLKVGFALKGTINQTLRQLHPPKINFKKIYGHNILESSYQQCEYFIFIHSCTCIYACSALSQHAYIQLSI